MEKTSLLFCFIFCAILCSCGSSKDNFSEADRMAFDSLKTSIQSTPIKFEANAALPMQTFGFVAASNFLLRQTGNTSNRIFLNDRNDYLYVSQDSTNVHLSYYGELRIASYPSGRNGGITFKGQPIDLAFEENDKKQKVTLKYNIRNDSESFQVTMVLFPNGKASVIVSSMNRTTIQYDGTFTFVENSEI